jgi:hypothetical protein
VTRRRPGRVDGPERRGPERPGPDYPAEWDDEPLDDGLVSVEAHDDEHPVWVEGCDACVDRASWIEAQHVTKPPDHG